MPPEPIVKTSGDNSDGCGILILMCMAGIISLVWLSATWPREVEEFMGDAPQSWEKAPQGVVDALQARNPDAMWAAYRNVDVTHVRLNEVEFLIFSDGAPEHLPDTEELGPGWRWRYAGILNMETGEVEK